MSGKHNNRQNSYVKKYGIERKNPSTDRTKLPHPVLNTNQAINHPGADVLLNQVLLVVYHTVHQSLDILVVRHTTKIIVFHCLVNVHSRALEVGILDTC